MKHTGIVTRCGVGLLICAIAILFLKFFLARTALRNEPYIPDDGSIVRSQIYDAIWENRPQSNPYFLHDLFVQGDWAIADAGIQRGVDGNIAATLQRVHGKWTIVHSFFHDDVPSGEEFSADGKLKDFPASLVLPLKKKWWDPGKNISEDEEKQFRLNMVIEECKRLQKEADRIRLWTERVTERKNSPAIFHSLNEESKRLRDDSDRIRLLGEEVKQAMSEQGIIQ